MVEGGWDVAAVAIGMITEFKNNIYSFYYVFTILQGLPLRTTNVNDSDNDIGI